VAVAQHIAASSYPLLSTGISVESSYWERATRPLQRHLAGCLALTRRTTSPGYSQRYSDLKEFGDAVDQLALGQRKQARAYHMCPAILSNCHCCP
jgi:hypothetical protein